jgi:hypothetical protein
MDPLSEASVIAALVVIGAIVVVALVALRLCVRIFDGWAALSREGARRAAAAPGDAGASDHDDRAPR